MATGAREELPLLQEMRKEAGLDMEETVACTIELPEGTRFDDAFALVQADWLDWLAEEGRVELAFDDAGDDARTWDIKDVDVRIALER